MKPQAGGPGCLPSPNAEMGEGPPTGEVRLPVDGIQHLLAPLSQGAPVESTEPEHSKEERVDAAFPLGTHLPSSEARGGREHEREWGYRGAERNGDPAQALPAPGTVLAAPDTGTGGGCPCWDSTGIQSLVPTRTHCPCPPG